MRSRVLAMVLVTCMPALHAACLTDDEVSAVASAYAQRRTIAQPPVVNADDARCCPTAPR